jgi:3-oxoacyl-[acyl-carrier protein] reductase
MDLGLGGRAYLVTGGTRGLGLATARALVADGASVVVSGRSAEGARSAAGSLDPERAVGIAADNADPGTAQRLVDACLAAFGRVDGALVSVGGPPPGATLDITDDQWTSSFESIVLGALRTARAVVGALPPEGGSIAFVLSSSVRQPIPGLAISNGLRPALAMLAKSMADELGPRGIRVNALLPGRISTERIIELDARRDDAEIAAVRAGVPLRRDGHPEEFGAAAAFLLSPAASYLTGVMLPVDGGALRAL